MDEEVGKPKRKFRIPEGLNVALQCRAYKVPLWQCPEFLFIAMGFVVIVAMTGTFYAINRLEFDPAVSVIAVSGVTALFFTMGEIIISSFRRIAEASRAKSEFVSIVSHQLRTPLSAVKWQIGVAKEKMKRGTVDLMPTFQVIEEENEQVIKMVNMLLEVNRIEERRFVIDRKPISLKKFTESTIIKYQAASGAVGVEIIFEQNVPGEFMVTGDEIKLRWVMENLFDNALKYSRKGGKVFVKLFEDKGRAIRWEIRDQGMGIPKKDQKRIFQKFFRAGNVSNLETTGSGLGLFIVKSYLEAMGAKIFFHSEEGKGTAFWFIFKPVSPDWLP